MSRLIFGWLTGLVSSMPLRLGYALAGLLTEIHFRFFPARRHGALANLAVAMPEASRKERMRIVRSMMRNYNSMVFEFLRLPHMEREDLMSRVEIVGRHHLDDAVSRGRGVIIASSHCGNWELAAAIVAQWGYTLYAVAGVQLSRWLTPAVRESKSELAVHTVSPDDGFRKLISALNHGDLVALLVDGDLYRHGVTVDFMGRETRWPAGPGVLAQRTGALVVCGACERTGPGRFRIVLEPALDPASFSSTAELNGAVAGTVERHIRERIDQWCIFRPLWEGQPSPDAEPAAEGRSVVA